MPQSWDMGQILSLLLRRKTCMWVAALLTECEWPSVFHICTNRRYTHKVLNNMPLSPVSSYWFQFKDNSNALSGFEANKQLKIVNQFLPLSCVCDGGSSCWNDALWWLAFPDYRLTYLFLSSITDCCLPPECREMKMFLNHLRNNCTIPLLLNSVFTGLAPNVENCSRSTRKRCHPSSHNITSKDVT